MDETNFEDLLSEEYCTLNMPDIDEINYGKLSKELRKKLNMSQVSFAKAIGVNVNTVEKWEMGKNNPSATAKRLLYLLDNDLELINQLYSIEKV